MANELKVTCRLEFSKGDTEHDFAITKLARTIAGAQAMANRQSIGTSEEAVLVGDVAAGGYFMGVNRDSTNYIELRPGSGLGDLIRLEAGDVCLFRLTDDATLYAIADTDTCDLEYLIIDA